VCLVLRLWQRWCGRCVGHWPDGGCSALSSPGEPTAIHLSRPQPEWRPVSGRVNDTPRRVGHKD